MDVVALSGFAFVASITPGPNNVMLWASGLNYGLRRTVPHVAGINVGFASLLVVIGLGLGTVVTTVPAVSLAMKVVGGGYLLFLAYRVATADGEVVSAGSTPAAGDGDGTAESGRPLSFFEAAAFQYLNPKAWVIGVTAAGVSIPEDASLRVAVPLFVATFALVSLPCILVWAGAGNLVGRLLQGDQARRWTNRVLGALLAASVVLIVV